MPEQGAAMRKRHSMIDRGLQFTAGGAAALVFCLAGTATGLAQPAAPGALPGIRNPMAQANPPAAERVKVDEHMIVDLHVNDEDLLSILQMLSLQSQKSIVASRNVSSSVTANLYGVTFYEALDAILHVNGYGYIERGNFIYVYTLSELKEIEAAQRVRVWRIIKTNYLSGVDAAEFVRPLLSEQGQIKTNGRPATFSDAGILTGEDFANDTTLLIYDYEENLGEIGRVLQELDTRPAQVQIEATILQTALTEANAFGIDFSVIGDMSFGDFLNLGGPLRVVDAMIGGAEPADNRGQAVVSTVGNTAGPATLKFGIVQNDVAAFLRLLDEVSDTQILSRPQMLVLNRAVGRVLVGRKVGYLSTTSTDTATTQTVEFLDTGTQLVVRPFISSDGMIRMELKPKVSEAVIRNSTTVGGQAVTIPDEISNELTTVVLVRDGQTIVLGGLFHETTQATRRQVPFVGDLPFIGAAFRGHEDEVQRSEVIFMITPTIVADNVLLEQGRRAEAAVDQVRAGSRQGLLPWSRDKRTQQMLVQAQEAARRGDTRGALSKVNRALRLNPFQADAIAMREQLTQRRSDWPTRSMNHEILYGEIERMTEARPAAAPATPTPKAATPAPTPAAPKAEAQVEVSQPVSINEEEFDLLFPAPAAPKGPEQAEVPEDQHSSAAPVKNSPVAEPERSRPVQPSPAVAVLPQASGGAVVAKAAPEPRPVQAVAQRETAAPAPAVVQGSAAAEPAAPAAAPTPAATTSRPSSSPWSSALTAALEESGETFEFAAPEQPRQQASGEVGANGVLGVFSPFYSVWDLFRSYADQSASPGTVTAAPTGEKQP
jgi:type IV pilus assembly protein PilQ